MCPVCGHRRLVVRSSAAGRYEYCPNCLSIIGRPRSPRVKSPPRRKRKPGLA